MIVKMTAKNQITIPKRITDALDLTKGSMFDIVISKNKIELIPLEAKEKVFRKDIYKKLDIPRKKR
ncbi:MAG: AbrB/MazE/SpoVT family DNA-binding domain-containing protein [Planctomycetota bacterium]|jgi:AbrB family looped-hinge helix DNA binding protein